jgi:molybdate transport system regulatory protein
MQPKFNLWIEQDGKVVLSTWRVALLEAIAATGSISGGAAQLKVPYRRAWEKVQAIELGLGEKVLETEVGGAGGGGARLTAAGRRAMEAFHSFAAGFEDEVGQRFQAAFADETWPAQGRP